MPKLFPIRWKCVFLVPFAPWHRRTLLARRHDLAASLQPKPDLQSRIDGFPRTKDFWILQKDSSGGNTRWRASCYLHLDSTCACSWPLFSSMTYQGFGHKSYWFPNPIIPNWRAKTHLSTNERIYIRNTQTSIVSRIPHCLKITTTVSFFNLSILAFFTNWRV